MEVEGVDGMDAEPESVHASESEEAMGALKVMAQSPRMSRMNWWKPVRKDERTQRRKHREQPKRHTLRASEKLTNTT